MVARSALRSAVRLASLIPLTAALLLLAAPVAAEHDDPGPAVSPTTEAFPGGDPACPEGTTGIRFGPQGDAALEEDASAGGVTLTELDIEGGTLSFEVAPPDVAVLVFMKGGNDQNVYDYSEFPAGGVAHDDGLVTPNNSSGTPAGVSHVDFCVAEGETFVELSITKAENDADDTLEPGDSVTFTITATNSGNADATNVVITDDLDDGLTVSSASFSNDGGTATDCTVTPGTNAISCAVGTLGAGKSAVATITAQATAAACGTIQNTSTVDSGETDAVASNTVTLTVACESILAITKAENDDDNTLAVGQDVTFTITATNSGELDATGVVITDNLDDDLTVLSASFSNNNGAATACTVGTGNAVSCVVGTLAAGTSAVATIVADVQDDACGPIQNTSSVDSDQTGAANSNTVNLTVFCEGTQAGGGGPSGGNQAGGGVPNTATDGVGTLPAIALALVLVVMLGYLTYLRAVAAVSRRR